MHILAVFLKYPTLGRVKTRLATTVGDEEAARIYRELTAGTLQHIPWDMVQVWICYDLPEQEKEIREWLAPNIPENADVHYIAQSRGDLGQRMQAITDKALRSPQSESITLVGTDCPDMRWPFFVITRRMAAENIDCTFGPTTDGGYYLLALRRPCPELFIDIPWSSPLTLESSLKAATLAGRKVHLLNRVLRDIDTAEDLEAWQTERLK